MIDEFTPPKPKWNVDQIPDLTAQVMIVTGGNTGLFISEDFDWAH